MRERLFIDGKWVEPEARGTFEVLDPATEELLHRAPAATQADVDRAVAAARRAFERGWDGPYGCGGDCFGGESFLFDSQEGRIWLWQWSEEPRPETAALRAVTDALIREMSGCTGGTLTQQCVVETP